jgi:hypothetical protein
MTRRTLPGRVVGYKAPEAVARYLGADTVRRAPTWTQAGESSPWGEMRLWTHDLFGAHDAPPAWSPREASDGAEGG